MKKAHLSSCKLVLFNFPLQMQVLPVCVWNTHGMHLLVEHGAFSAVSIRPLQEAASSITVSVNIVSPHLPIGSLCFGLQHLCFQTCVLTDPHLALLSGIPLPKRIQLIPTLHAASILKFLCSKTSLSPLLANSRQSLQDLAYYCLCFIFGSRLLWKMSLWNCWFDAVRRWQDLITFSNAWNGFSLLKKGLTSAILPQLIQYHCVNKIHWLVEKWKKFMTAAALFSFNTAWYSVWIRCQ